MTLECQQSDNTVSGIAPAACEIKWTDLLHVTGDHSQIYCLTKEQLQDIVAEEQHVSEPIKTLLNAYSQSNEQILATKSQTWKTLEEEKLIPPLKAATEAKPLEKYKQQRDLAKKRYEKQLIRLNRLKNDIHIIKQELKHGFLNKPTRQFYLRYVADLQQDVEDLSHNLDNLKKLAHQKKQMVANEESRVKKLREATEKEVEYRVAQQAFPAETVSTLKQLKESANALATESGLNDYVSKDELQEITDTEIQLLKLEQHIEINAAQMRELRVLMYLQGINSQNRLLRTSSDSLQRYEQQQSQLYQTKAKLIADKNAFYESLDLRSPVEAPTSIVDLRNSYNLIEIKRTGSQNFSYIRKEALEQFKRNWQKIPISEVKRALTSINQGIEGSARQVGKGLSENFSGKLKFAEWQSKEDHFFNQLNKELLNVSLNGDLPPEERQFDSSAEAQLMRFSAGVQFAGEYNPQEGKIHVGAEANASYNLLQGSVKTTLWLPSEAGYALKLSYTNGRGEVKQLHCGHFRSQFALNLQGSVGACAMLGTTVRIDTKPGELSVGGETNGKVFAGGVLKGEAKIGVHWAKPKEMAKGAGHRIAKNTVPDFSPLVEVTPTGSLAFGIGAGFDFSVGYEEGKFELQLSAELVCGPGGAGGIAVELSVEKVIELIQFVRQSLEQSDFRFLEWVSKKAFDRITLVIRVYLVSKDLLEECLNMSDDDLKRLWSSMSLDQSRVKASCQEIINSPISINISTPTAKAMVLDKICETYVFRERSFELDDDEIQAAACMKVLESIKFEREFIEILRCMNESGTKLGADEVLKNFHRLFNTLLFRSRQRERVYHWLEEVGFLSTIILE